MPDGIKGIDKQGLADLANIKNTIDVLMVVIVVFWGVTILFNKML